MLLPHGSRMSSSQKGKCFFSWICLPTDFWLIFSFDLLPPLKRWRRCWLMGPRCQPPRTKTCDILIILQTINSVFRSELLQTDKLNLYFYINKLICWIFLFCVFAKHRTFLFFLEKSELSCFGVGWNCTSQKAQQDSSKAQMSRCSPIEIFLFLDFFHPLISGYFIFLLVLCRLGNIETAAAKWDPHVILYVQ